ncbi:MAG TPA: hypothetical protein ENG30_02085 [Thermofilaceae archaeon]|nr:hypothetical protein [Thermofilaceae archaeon]
MKITNHAIIETTVPLILSFSSSLLALSTLAFSFITLSYIFRSLASIAFFLLSSHIPTKDSSLATFSLSITKLEAALIKVNTA